VEKTERFVKARNQRADLFKRKFPFKLGKEDRDLLPKRIACNPGKRTHAQLMVAEQGPVRFRVHEKVREEFLTVCTATFFFECGKIPADTPKLRMMLRGTPGLSLT
jgi:hypothetical protein